MAAILLAAAGIAATPPLYHGGHFRLLSAIAPCAQAIVIREQVGWILQLSWLSIAFLGGAAFTGMLLVDPLWAIRRLRDVWGR